MHLLMHVAGPDVRAQTGQWDHILLQLNFSPSLQKALVYPDFKHYQGSNLGYRGHKLLLSHSATAIRGHGIGDEMNM